MVGGDALAKSLHDAQGQSLRRAALGEGESRSERRLPSLKWCHEN